MSGHEENERGVFKDLLKKVAPGGTKRQKLGKETTPPDQPIGGTGAELLAVAATLTPGQTEMKQVCRRLQISPPRKQDGQIADHDEVMSRIRADGFDGEYVDGDDNRRKILIFLYGREYNIQDEGSRKELVRLLAINTSADTQRRMLNLIGKEHDDTHRSNAATRELNGKWMNILQNEYATTAGSQMGMTIFKGNVQPAYRFQVNDGNCFLHAPALVQAYKVNINQDEWKGMMDIAAYARRNFNPNDLKAYAFDQGGNSWSTLMSILRNTENLGVMTTSKIRSEVSKISEKDPSSIWANLQTYGPALVSHFYVDANFRSRAASATADTSATSPIPFLDDNIDLFSKGIGSHAMVLVGMRLKEGKWRFLIQNFWKGMPFLEVSGEYLISSQAWLYWTSDQTSIPDNVPVLTARHAETCIEGIDDKVGPIREHEQKCLL